MDYATQFIGQVVEVTIDRPIGSKHPKYNFDYPINYGYVKGVLSPDGEEVDAYILGVEMPLNIFRGKCIAVMHRLDDDDDKLIVVPNGRGFSNEEIYRMTNFQEKFFNSEIIR